MSKKRTRDGNMVGNDQAGGQSSSPFMEMFEGFRKELDEHHDRRERIVKASRDITASSKKIIFTLQRVRNLGESLPQFAVKSNAQYWETIEKQFKAIAADVQNLNAYRYPQLTWGNQEFMEAVSFQHYLETQTLISYEDSKSRVAALCGDGHVVPLTPEDYVLGIFDMIGELMRFSITGIANNGKLPTGKENTRPTGQGASVEEAGDQMDIDEELSTSKLTQQPRNVLEDLREIRLQLEMFEPPRGDKFYGEVEKKAVVMRECVDKVEKALYQLTVRGKERPKGWRPDAGEERRPEVESY